MGRVSVKRVMEHYEIYVDGDFYCSCDVNEISETLSNVMEEVRNETKDEQSSDC